MKVQVELNHEMIDAIVQEQLKWHYEYSKDSNIKDMGKIDKAYFKKLNPALEIVCEYFGVQTNDKRSNKRVR